MIVTAIQKDDSVLFMTKEINFYSLRAANFTATPVVRFQLSGALFTLIMNYAVD